MKRLLCDFCDSVRLGIRLGYKEFNKTFNESRQIRKHVKSPAFLSVEVYDCINPNDAKIQDIRELAQKYYREETTK
jgi:hypothetical protein